MRIEASRSGAQRASKATGILMYAAAAVLLVFCAFMLLNVHVMGRLPALMETLIGRTTAEIGAFDPAVLRFMLGGFRMFTLLLFAFAVGLLLLTHAYRAGNAAAGRAFFVMQGLFCALATVQGFMVSPGAPWPVFALSGILTLIAYVLASMRNNAVASD